VTTCHLRRVMASDGLLLCVDPYPVDGTIQWMRKTGRRARREYAAAKLPAVDFVFIDGDHTYAGLREDWEAWSGLIDSAGIVALYCRTSGDREWTLSSLKSLLSGVNP
jgi:hypothetical protein